MLEQERGWELHLPRKACLAKDGLNHMVSGPSSVDHVCYTVTRGGWRGRGGVGGWERKGRRCVVILFVGGNDKMWFNKRPS